MVSRAHAAVFIYLVRQVFSLRGIEAQLGKELRAAGEEADAAHLMLACFRHERLHQQFAPAALLIILVDCDGANLCQVRAIKVQSSAAYDVASLFEDRTIPNVLADFRQRPWQK